MLECVLGDFSLYGVASDHLHEHHPIPPSPDFPIFSYLHHTSTIH